MLSIPTPVLVVGFLVAWAGLSLSWTTHIQGLTEARRLDAVARGEQPPHIRGVSNYERAEMMETAHRQMMRTRSERLWSLFILAGIPLIGAAILILKL